MWRLIAFTVTYVVSNLVLSWDISSGTTPLVIALISSALKIELFILHERHWCRVADHVWRDFVYMLCLATAPCILWCYFGYPWVAAGWLFIATIGAITVSSVSSDSTRSVVFVVSSNVTPPLRV